MGVGLRVPVLVGAALTLLGGLYAALLLSGAGVPAPSAPVEEVHGPVMVLGFVGSLVALERAVALGRRIALPAPGCSAAGGLVLLGGGPWFVGKLLLVLGGVGLLGIYRELWKRGGSVALLAQVVGAFAWCAAGLLWVAGFLVPEVVPWLVVFVVATIAGERLELARVGMRGAGVERWFLGVLCGLVVGALAVHLWPSVGGHLFGFALLALTGWLVVFDVARRTVRGSGLPRYVAAGLLAGYGWLAVAGVLWAGGGVVLDGDRYDAVLHSVFLGFTMSMVFAHAPVILPAVLRRPLPYHRALYAPLALLHLSLAVRVGIGDTTGLKDLWRWACYANVVAVLGFVGCAAALSSAAGRKRGTA
ncbi:hypothetical protein KCV87_31640 [Actinosynnema pretiosum subsp. pretiosum]|uniref:NnrS family protein n=1 Tax=Actinosynnema pretiosum subsp. pretiosum TaxID=103721 RepID=A0AA45L5V9_9PSEU|nr:hypothetical protein APASM_4811 [Actinosynnema pretiosum subsp. pretiosum]QUF03867.1 hypothetical protein KCV87_31640 [Actinosynnema pretiosum subsp. pretiosum]